MNIDHFPPMPAIAWVPVRTIHTEQRCWFCKARIPPGKPGTTRGTRGTKAWWNKVSNLWECLDCHAEATRAEVDRAELDDAKRSAAVQPATPPDPPASE